MKRDNLWRAFERTLRDYREAKRNKNTIDADAFMRQHKDVVYQLTGRRPRT